MTGSEVEGRRRRGGNNSACCVSVNTNAPARGMPSQPASCFRIGLKVTTKSYSKHIIHKGLDLIEEMSSLTGAFERLVMHEESLCQAS